MNRVETAEESVEVGEVREEKQEVQEERARRRKTMINEITCGAFQYSTGEELTTVGTRWEMWLERFKLFVHAQDLEEERIKSTFLLMIGHEAYEVYKSIRSKDGNETPEQAYKLLTDHFTARRSEFAEEQKFRHMRRRDGEPVHDYVMRLRQQAIHCKFGEAMERNILSQFVAGSNMPAFQERCCRTNDLNLANAIASAQGYESSAQNMNTLINPAAQASIMYAGKWNGRGTEPAAGETKTRGQCKWCGGRCTSKDNCKAKDKQRRKCGKMNHFASICRSLKSDNQEARDKKAIRAIEEKNPEAGKRYSLDCGEYAEYTRFKQNQSYGLFALAGGESSRTND
jgi:hypothetical protein